MNFNIEVPVQRAGIDLQIGKSSLRVMTEITSGGLLAIGGLVAAILLASAVLVATATRSRVPTS